MNTEKLCPLCGEPNNCMADSAETCWCNNVIIPQQLLDQVPEDKKRKACICLRCIKAFQQK